MNKFLTINFDNLDEINKSLTKTHSRKENWGGLISIKDIRLQQVLPQRKKLQFYQGILPKEDTISILHELSKIKEEKNTFQTSLVVHGQDFKFSKCKGHRFYPGQGIKILYATWFAPLSRGPACAYRGPVCSGSLCCL